MMYKHLTKLVRGNLAVRKNPPLYVPNPDVPEEVVANLKVIVEPRANATIELNLEAYTLKKFKEDAKQLEAINRSIAEDLLGPLLKDTLKARKQIKHRQRDVEIGRTQEDRILVHPYVYQQLLANYRRYDGIIEVGQPLRFAGRDVIVNDQVPEKEVVAMGLAAEYLRELVEEWENEQNL